MFELLISGFKKKEQFLNNWLLLEPTSSKPIGRTTHTLVNVGSKLYLHGGVPATGGSRIGDLWEYDIVNNTWTQLNPTGTTPSARYNHTLVNVGDKLYLHGGSSGGDQLWEYTVPE